MPPAPPTPPPGSASGAGSPLVVWGGAILVVVVLAFLGILFLPSLFKANPTPTLTPTTGVVPGVTATVAETLGMPTSETTPRQTPAATATAIVSEEGGRIAFTRSDDSGFRSLWVVNADGTNEQRVTDSVNVEGSIAWMPDGSNVILQVGVEGVSRVVRIEIGRDNKLSSSAQLTADVEGDSVLPSTSPDGTKVAYQYKPPGGAYQIYVMNVDGTNKHMVSDGNGNAGLPVWSPDNKTVAYLSGEQQTTGSVKEVWVADVDNGTPRKITNLGVGLTYPAWSPDGKSIAFVEIVSEREYKLHLTDANGNNQKTLDEGLIIRWPIFSPDGKAIVYYTISAVGNDIIVYDLESGRTNSVTKNQGDNYQPIWSPGGTMLAWAGQQPGSGQHKVMVANRDGSNKRTVTTGEGDDAQPVWGR